MADLQEDDLTTTAEAGELDEPAGLTELTEPAGPVPSEAVLPGHPPAVRAPADDPDDAVHLERARALLAASPVADGYSGLARVLSRLPWYDLEEGVSDIDTDVPRLRGGHVGALFCSLHLPDGPVAGRAVAAVLELLDVVGSVVDGHPEGLRPARTAGEVLDAGNCGRTAVLLGPAPAVAIDDSLALLRVLHGLGVRVLTLAGVPWAGEAGLTRFGEEVVREMNRLGVLIDLSGASARTAHRVLAIAKAPVVCARSGARALRPHPANLPDDLLAALGAAKGLCMVPLTAEQTGPTVRDVADHLDHVRALAGPECVGLSGAYDAGWTHPGELTDVSCYPHLVAELLRRGWSDGDVAALTWGNVQRVLRGADFAARAAQERRGPSTARIDELDG